MSLAPGTRCGPYEVLGLLGAGGMGEVYRARDDRLGREVALKVLPESLAQTRDRLARFEREARAASSLNHPNVLVVYDIGSYEGMPYLVSELLEGKSLRDLLDSGPIGLRKAIDYGHQVADGLAAAHQQGIVHRDLKPENLFVCSDERVKILDFGLAKLVDRETSVGSDERTYALEQDLKTGAGVILGTVGYMSPEQVRGQPADRRSDLFSLGAVLYEMCSGRSAFRAESAVETMHAILAAEPPEIDAIGEPVPAGLRRIIARCLEKEPGRRFQSAADLAFSLETLVGTGSITRDPTALADEPRRRALPLVAILAGAAVVAAVVVALVLHLASRGPEPSVTFRRLTFRSGNIPAARFAPDGQTVIYAAGWEGAPVQLFSTRLDGPESRRLDLPPSGLFSISSDGTLALALGCRLNWSQCQGTLAEMPLAGGAPRELLEDVDFADWDPARERLAVVRARDGRYRVEYPIGRVLFETDGWISGLRFSPDGARLAFCEHPVLGRPEGNVSVVDLEGERTILSDGWQDALTLAWSPDGKEVRFGAVGEGADLGASHLWATTLAGNERPLLAAASYMLVYDTAPDGRALIADIDGGAVMMALVPSADRDQVFSWFDWSTVADLSADGEQLLFFEWGSATGGVPTVYVRPTDGGDAIRLGEGRSLALSPDGRLALVVRDSPPRLVLLPLGPGQEHELDNTGVVAYSSARWFPDGKRILFTGEGEDGVFRTYYQQIDGGPAEPAPVLGVLADLVSPDGERIAGYGLDGERYVCDTGGEECLPIEGTEPGDRLLQWGADGTTLFLMVASNDAIDVFRLSLDTGERRPWRTIAPVDAAGMIGFELDGVRITPDGRYHAYSYWRSLDTLLLVEGLR